MTAVAYLEPLAGPAPGPWLRATALLGALATTLAVASGELHLTVAHRLAAAVALPVLVAVAVGAIVAHRSLLPLAGGAVALTLASVVLGAAVGAGDTWVSALHLVVGALASGAALAAAFASLRARCLPAGVWRDYITLTKPRIMSLLLLTGGAAMVVGASGWPSPIRAAETLVGLGLACGGASALNHVIDRDIDRLMGNRTSLRPVAAGRVPATQAVEFGLALSASSFALLAGAVNLLSACLALAGNLFYVFVYTSWLKRSTRHNIVIGGAAGAIPPLVGYAAATGRLDLVALLLFLLVFVWTPPHFWALALLLRRQYEQAGIPMLPVVAGDRETTRQIVAYSVVLVAVSVVPFALAGFGLAYIVAALGCGAVFLFLAVRLRRQVTPRRAGVLFHYSLAYLALVFIAAAAAPPV
ncbi:MAG: heme o synthase [Solirubrobacteraceae bacterium]|nr:heme o synthase [Solirubrobacteraceae bacterium]